MTAIDRLTSLKAIPDPDPSASAGPRAPGDGQVHLSDAAREVAASLSDRPVSRTLLLGGLRLGEGLVLAGLGPLAWYLNDTTEMGISWLRAAEFLLGGAIAVLYIQAFEGYALAGMRSFFQQFGRVIAAWTMVFATLVTVTILRLGTASAFEPWLSLWFVSGVMALAVERAVLAYFIRRLAAEGRLERRAVIVGGGKAAEELIRALEYQPDNDIRICGVFDDRGSSRSPDIVAGYPKLGNVAELVAFGRLARLDMLLVTLPVTAEKRVLQLLHQLWVLPVDIRLSANANRLKYRPRSYSYLGTVPVIDVVDKPIADWDAVAKRIFDLIFASISLVLLSPVMVGTAIAIKATSHGPILFRQRRYGFNNELIEVWKFRSMYTDMADATAAKLVTRDDPRVTRVGRFIRKTSIDELPQLFNVLAGTLSLVGPRPHALAAKAGNRLYEQVVDGYFARHKVKPGVTGWAQINGWRGETDTKEKIEQRVRYDLEYIENWSLFFDLKILFLTPFSLLKSENAY